MSKKIVFSLSFSVFLSLNNYLFANTFDYVVKTTVAQQSFGIQVDSAIDLTIEWGDGITESGITGSGVYLHTYNVAGTYTNKLNGGAQRIAFGNFTGATPQLLKDILTPLSSGISGINSAKEMFYQATAITAFTCSDWFDGASTNVISTAYMFYGATKFNQDISGWNVAKVTDMQRMFYSARAFNQDIGGWDVSKVKSMNYMFEGASLFNGDIGAWNVSSVRAMHNMFKKASNFNADISGWQVGNVTSMGSMFEGAQAFNQDIGGWDVSKVTSIESMLRGLSKFDQDISRWNVANVTTLAHTFDGATKFNADISDWNVGKVTSMRYAFLNAKSFNQNLSRWDVSKVTDMFQMFKGATAFNQDISRWNVERVANFKDFLRGVTLATELYNSLLIRWGRQSLRSEVEFDGGNSKYDLGWPAESRGNIISTYGWTISDGGPTGRRYQLPATILYVR